ncbi:GTP cyclohydrolase II [Weeksellaceae bacterium A-14]
MIRKQAESNVPTEYGTFKIMAFSENENDWMPQMVLVAENTDFSKPVNVRFHSECITGEVFHSRKCECGQQLDAAMRYIHEHGGIIVYLRQEGRNIGIINKLRAYALQEKGLDTVEANLRLGLPADDRTFDTAIEILKQLGVQEINLLTNNPEKIKYVENSDIKLNHRIPLQIHSNENSKDYLLTKKKYFGHLLVDEDRLKENGPE